MNNQKEKAINQILQGFALQIFPVLLVGLSKRYLDSLFPILTSLIALYNLGFFLLGYIFFIKGCCLYSESKGYSYNWGWIGLLSLLGLSILLLIPSKKNIVCLQSESLANELWEKINIPELLLSWMIALPFLFSSILGIFCLLNKLDFSILAENLTILNLFNVFLYIYFGLIVLKKIRSTKIDFNKIIGYQNHINLKLIAVIVTINFTFALSFNTLTLYNLSFILPKYVESYINEKHFTNISEAILWSFTAMLLAPVIEELLLRGIVLQKWVIKWGVKAGLLTSSLLFAILHFRYDIIPLFVWGILWSILYFKTRCLISSMIAHFFHNTIVVILDTISYFSKSTIERSSFISVKHYQTSVQPLLNQRVFLLAIFMPLVIYFIYKNFPKNDAIIPYDANDAKRVF